jgi:GT2 family glycosyltransferase
MKEVKTTTSSPVFSIIIVNYNSGHMLETCITSVTEHIQTGYEVIVYDNASEDDSLARVKSKFHEDQKVILIEGDQNLGFSKANNAAVRHASGRFLHFLNPDTVVNPRLRADYHRIAQEEDGAVYVTSLVDEDVRPVKNKHLVPRIGNFGKRLFYKKYTAYWNIGASIIMDRNSYMQAGGWCEDYFIYAEDLDLFYTLHKRNIPVKYLDTKITHVGKGVTNKVWSESERALRVELAFKKFYLRHGFPKEYYLVRPIQLFWILFNEPGGFSLSLKTFMKATFIRTR